MAAFLFRAWCRGFMACLPFVALTSDAGNPLPGYSGPREKLHIYILLGDASMESSSEFPAEQQETIDRCYLFNDKNEWEPAKGPLNRYSTIRDNGKPCGLTPGIAFATAMLENDPDISVGLVVNAGGSSRIEDWHAKSRYYRQARGRMKAAARSGVVKGVLWRHGSSVRLSALDHMKDLISYMRVDYGDLNLPVVVGEVSDAHMNRQLAALADDVHAVGVAGIGDPASADKGKGSLDADETRGLGQRYAEQMRNIQHELMVRRESRPPMDIPLFDSHIHAPYDKLDVTAQWMEKNNIEKCISHTLTPMRPENEEQRAAMVAAHRRYQGRIFRFCVIDPDEVDTVEEAVAILEREKADGAVGFGEHYGRDLMFDDPANLRLYAACEKVGFPVMFHIDQSKNMVERSMKRVERVLEMFPDCKIIAHAQWWLYLPSGVCDRMMQKYPNLYADISGRGMTAVLNRDRGYSRDFLIRHADRVMFGSDAGWWNIKDAQEPGLTAVLDELDLPREVRVKIYRTNAERLLGLTDDGEAAQ